MIDEFMSRFNMEEFAPTVNQSEPDARRMNLYSLVDFDYATSSDSVSNRVIGFADAVLNHDIKLQFEDTAWCAIAKCVGKLNKKEVSFNLKLTTEHRGQGMYKWVIKDAEGMIFDLEPTVDLHTVARSTLWLCSWHWYIMATWLLMASTSCSLFSAKYRDTDLKSSILTDSHPIRVG